MLRKACTVPPYPVLLIIFCLVFCSSALGQGSIFGTVMNSDLSIPADSELTFFGFLNQADNEIRLSTSDGAGYDGGNWYDDFQNYIDEAPGIPYEYHFFGLVNGEFFRLSKLVPDNSFQHEDIQLTPSSFPSPPAGLTATWEVDNRVRLKWRYAAELSYHVYRRVALSNGSFFRIDNPSGDLSDPGVFDSTYFDTAITGTELYSYVIIAQNVPGVFSPPSPIVTADSSGCCRGLTGNIDNDPDDLVDIGDVSRLIDHLFITYVPLECPQEANIDGDPDGLVDIGDLTWLIDFLFITYTPLGPCQ